MYISHKIVICCDPKEKELVQRVLDGLDMDYKEEKVGLFEIRKDITFYKNEE